MSFERGVDRGFADDGPTNIPNLSPNKSNIHEADLTRDKLMNAVIHSIYSNLPGGVIVRCASAADCP